MGLLDHFRKKNISSIRIMPYSAYNNNPDFLMEVNIENDPALRKAKIPDWFLQHPYGRPRSDDITTLRTLAQMGIVQRCINLVLDQIFSIPWDIVPKKGNNLSRRIEEKIRYIKDFLMAVNSNEENYFQELRRALTDYLEIGEGVIVKLFTSDSYVPLHNQLLVPKDANATLVGLQAYDASQFFVFQDEYGRILGHWQFNFVRSPPRFFSKRELIVFRDQPTTYFVYGRSRVKQIQDMLEWVFSQIRQTRQFYKSGAVFQGFIKTIGLNKNEQEALEKYVKEKFSKQKHKLGIFHGGKDSDIAFERLMLDVKDLAFLEGLDFVQKFVMSLFGVTPAELGITDAVNKASAEQQSQVFQRRYRVLMNMIEYRTNTEIISELDPDGEVEFKFIYDTDPQVKKAEQDIAASQLSQMQITINEWRREQGLDPVPWGDVPAQIMRMQHSQAMLQSRLKLQQQVPDGTQQDNLKDDSEQDSGKMEDSDSENEDKKKGLDPHILQEEYLKIEKAISDKIRDSRLAKLFNPIVRKLESGLRGIFRLWKRLVEDRLSRTDSLITISQIDQIIQGIDAQEMADEIRDSVIESYQKGLQLDHSMQLGFSLGRTDRRALEYIREYPLLIAEKVTDDIQNALKRELFEGMSKGESISKLKKRIQSVFETTNSRAETIARTEVTNASTWGKINQIRSFGGTRWQFYATEDERTCPICQKLHLKIFRIDDLENKPPVHPRCRCTILSVDEEEEDSGFPITSKMAIIELKTGQNIQKLLQGESIRKIAEKYDISKSTISNWKGMLKKDLGRWVTINGRHVYIKPIGKVRTFTKKENPYVAVEIEFNGYQGIKGVKELSQPGKITINHDMHEKLTEKGGHFVDRIKPTMNNPNYIFASKSTETKIETRIFAKRNGGKFDFVVIHVQGNTHELASAYEISKKDFIKKTKGFKKLYERE